MKDNINESTLYQQFIKGKSQLGIDSIVFGSGQPRHRLRLCQYIDGYEASVKTDYIFSRKELIEIFKKFIEELEK
jgi:hypothetical protein